MRMRASAGTALLLLLTGATLQAAEGPYFSPTTDRVRVSLGVLRSSNKSDARIDSTTGTLGTPFNAEQDLGLDDNKMSMAIVYWNAASLPSSLYRFLLRFALSVFWLSSRSASKCLR